MNNHQQTELMIVKHVLLKKCIENSIDNKNTDVKMWREQFFQSYYCRRLLLKNEFIYCMLSNQVLQRFRKMCLTENPYSVLLTCAVVANSEYDYFAMFSPSQWATMFSRIISSKYPQYLSHLDLYDTLQSKHRLVHSSPASPDHLTSVPLTSFQ